MKRFTTVLMRLLFYAVLIAPIILFILFAFSERWFFPELLPKIWTFSQFLDLISDPQIYASWGASLFIAGIVSFLSIVISLPAARVIGLRSFKGRDLAWIIFFIPTVVPPLAVGMGLNILFLRIGLSGSVFGVILSHLVPTLPYSIFTLSGVFARYDENYELQARVLGSSKLSTFFKVTIRLIYPGLIVATLFAFLISWSQYLLTLLIGGGRILTLPMLLFSAVSGGNPTSIALLSLVFILPPILIISGTSRYLVAHGKTVKEQL